MAVQRWLERWGVLASFVWGLAEATLFFVVPDVVVGAVAIVAPRKALTAALAAVAGAVVGGIVWWLAASSPDTATHVVDSVPAIHGSAFVEASARISDSGGAALLAAPFTGIPYKVWALELALRGWALPPLLLWTVAGRALRLVPLALVTAAAGWAARRWLRVASRNLLILWGAGWIVIYAVYWSRTGF